MKLCLKCGNEPADRGFSWGPRCDRAYVNAMRATNNLKPLSIDEYNAMFPTDAERAANAG